MVKIRAYWDDAYSNSAYIPDGDCYPARWAAAAAEFRAGQPSARLDQAYGLRPRERFDLFLPDAPPAGTLIFIHGGYWMTFDKSWWSHLAAGALARGWAVAMPSYTLCPEARIDAIVLQMAYAVEAVGALVQGPLRLAGHSAGGHLATRLCCDDRLLSEALAQRVDCVLSISGLHDLRPLLATSLNETLKLDPEAAAVDSPALLRPRPGLAAICWVGGDERPEFRRQSALLANIWSGVGAETELVEQPHRHHFNVIEDLARPDSQLLARLLS